MSKCPHTSFHKGTTVYVILKDGTNFVDKFEDNKSGIVILRKYGRIPKKDIRSMSVRRLDTK